MEKIKLEEIVKSSLTKTECLIKMGLRAAGGNYKTLSKYIEKYNIDITHFDSDNAKVKELKKYGDLRKIPLSEILVEGSFYNRSRLKERLYDEGIKLRICELCGQDENWQGKKMSLIIDHINGIWNDNRIENLRIVCPNCNATLLTHCRCNNKKINDQSEIDIGLDNKQKFYIKRRKTERPDYFTLINEVSILGYTKTGKKYGVSDNAIRKWLKFYQKHNMTS